MNVIQKHVKIDLHIHTTVSDGTDTPLELLSHVKEAGLTFFSVTDHDSVKGTREICSHLTQAQFITGVEFSCQDELGKYHILGYGFDPDSRAVTGLLHTGHQYRMKKLAARLRFLRTQFHILFPEEEILRLWHMDNPGKPHLGNLMVKYGYAKTKEQAIEQYINRVRFHSEYLRPAEAIAGILAGGGIPVLAHPFYGSGSQLITGVDMEGRLQRLIGFGLQGVEAFYADSPAPLRDEMLSFADKYGLYITAGSDYHGKNKKNALGVTGLENAAQMPDGLKRFLRDVRKKEGREGDGRNDSV
ncbi:MAG: PHP domain-containing protein [Lachnospiraceae bacterium]|nr:PHP domain-containing protein [Lachnospiraceae bacterium]